MRKIKPQRSLASKLATIPKIPSPSSPKHTFHSPATVVVVSLGILLRDRDSLVVLLRTTTVGEEFLNGLSRMAFCGTVVKGEKKEISIQIHYRRT